MANEMRQEKNDKIMNNILNGVSDEEKNELYQKSPKYRAFIKKLKIASGE